MCTAFVANLAKSCLKKKICRILRFSCKLQIIYSRVFRPSPSPFFSLSTSLHRCKTSRQLSSGACSKQLRFLLSRERTTWPASIYIVKLAQERPCILVCPANGRCFETRRYVFLISLIYYGGLLASLSFLPFLSRVVFRLGTRVEAKFRAR